MSYDATEVSNEDKILKQNEKKEILDIGKKKKRKRQKGREEKEGRSLIRNYSNQKTMERYLYICRN